MKLTELYLIENSTTHIINSQFFRDLKLIYQAHAAGEEPDKIVLFRTTETMILFIRSEVERTREMKACPPRGDDDITWKGIQSPEFTKMLRLYEEALDRLITAKRENDYRKMWIAIDMSINLSHWYGSVWDNLILSAKYSDDIGWYKKDPEIDKLHASLSAFMRTIGRFPKLPPKDWWNLSNGVDLLKQTRRDAWRFDDTGNKVPHLRDGPG